MTFKLRLTYILLIIIFFISGAVMGQSITGPTSVTVGNLNVYTFSDDALIAMPNWVASPGTVTYTWQSGINFNARVIWSTAGPGTLTFKDGSTVLATLNVTITGGAPSAPIVTDGFRCGTGTVTLTATPGNGGTAVHWFSTSTAPGGYLSEGNSFTTTSISSTTNYYASSYSSSSGLYSMPRISVVATVNPLPTTTATPTNNSRCGTGSITLNGTPGADANSLNWYSASTGGTLLTTGLAYVPTLSTTTTFYIVGYQTTTGCESTAARVPIIATINPIPAAPVGVSGSSCGTGTVALTATSGANGNTVLWYAAATGGSPLATGLSYTTPSLSATTVYYISSFHSTTLCESTAARVAVAATINLVPSAAAGTGANGCGTGTLTLTATSGSNGNTVRWYAASTGGSPIATGLSYTTPSLSATTTYYISSYHSTTLCESTAARTTVVASVNVIPTAPVGTSASRCGTGTVALTATSGANGNTVLWYAAATGGSPLATGLSYTTPSLSATTTYYISSYHLSTLCESTTARVAVTATINLVPSAAAGAGANRCGTGTLALAATSGSNGNTVRWYAAATGGSPLATGLSYTTPSLSATTTYYVSSYHSTTLCESTAARTAVVAIVNATPAAPVGTSTSICGTGTVPLSATSGANGNTVRWYAASTGGSPLATGLSYTTPSLSTTTTYYISSYHSTTLCESTTARVAVTATINSAPAAAGYTGNIRFGTGSLTLAGTGAPGGGSYKWYNSANAYQSTGLTYNTASLTSTVNNYMFVKAVSSAGCESSSAAVNVLVYALPSISASQTNIVKEVNVILDAGSGFDSYSWKNNANAIVATTQTFSTNVADTYTVTVTKTGVVGVSTPFVLTADQFSGLNMNYIVTNATQISGLTDENVIANLSAEKVAQTVAYFDGLGRPIQTVSTQSSSSKSDLVAPVVYDPYGREVKKYLPVVTESNGRYKTSLFDGAGNYLINTYNNPYDKIADDIRPFSETTFEPSPLNRPDKEYGAGQAWAPSGVGSNNKFIQHAYLINSHSTGSNATQEKIVAWIVNGSNLPVRAAVLANYVVTGGYYASNQLNIKSTKDEQGNEVREYSDKQGRVILKKVQAATSTDLNNLTQWSLTYYVYDDLGNLRFVFPPELCKLLHTNADTYAITTTDLSNWAFQYSYDERKRMITKQVPGSGVVYMVYDNRDRLVLTQDANQRATATKYWSFTKYDELNRPILAGIKDTTVALTQSGMQTAVNNHFAKASSKWGETYVGNVAGNVHGYTNKAYPVRTGGASEIDVNKYLSVTYYDNYSFRNLWYGTYTYLNESLSEIANGVTYTQPTTENLRVIGQVTGTKTKVLDGGVTGGYTWFKSINYYDDKYRVVQNLSDNYKGGTDRVTNVYDFVGKVLKSKSTHVEADISWKDLVSVKLEGNKLINTSSSSTWGLSGAASSQQLSVGQNGWVEFVYAGGSTERVVGLSSSNTNAHYNTINFGVYLGNPVVSNNAIIYESGTSKYTIPSQVVVGDVIRVERTGTSITYKVNGVLKYTSLLSSNTALVADMSFTYLNSSIVGARSSFSTTAKTTTRKFEYDHAGRLLKTWHQVDSGPNILLALNEYNELGQLVDKKLHSTTSTGADRKQSVDYRYNIRGWLTSMNDATLASTGPNNDDTGDLFGMNLAYNETTLGIGNTGLFNGNISGMAWSNNLGLGATKQNAYTYSYDAMNRILSSAFKEKTASWSAALSNSGLAESGFQYDLNGNIKNLTRNDKRTSGTMDILGYTYTGNQLLKVVDTGDKFAGFVDDPSNNTTNDYTYDANGNLTRDLNKGIGTSLTDPTNIITYNYLNLPETVTKGNNSIRYIYDAGGRKLTQVTTFGSQQKQTDYVGEYQYENDVLQFISHEEGRIAIANNKTLVTHNGDNTTNITAVTSTLAAVTANGTNTYARATASGTTAKQGMFPIGGTLTVAAGEQYRIRAKGYRAATNANMVHLYIRTNSTDLNWPGAQLPSTFTSESYVEQVITIPAGHTTLQAGVVWNTVANGEQFFLNDFEITKLTTNTTPEYQYNLKDHLGNVRLTFTSKDEVDVNTATLETANLNTEQSQFLRINNAKRINASIFDKTNGAATGYSERLNGSANEKYGVAKSISVMPGDVINAEVYAKYVDPTSSNWTGALTTLMSQIAANTAGVVVDGASYASSTASFPPGFVGLQTTSNNGAPRAYLNWLIFDRNFGFITGGFKQLTTAAREAGADVSHELLQMPAPITITQPGYVYIYLSNENPTTVEVYFDDFKVTHTKSPVIQSEDYYPFGLTFNSYQRENGLANKFVKFQGQEHIDDLNLGWDSFKWRNHQPEIGRFFNVDPISEKYYYNSPYAFSENKVVVHVELEGLESVYVFDKPTRPNDNGVAGTGYPGSVYVVHDNGTVNGPYAGSSYPNSKSNTDNSTSHRTIDDGTHLYNNESGHKGGTKKGLNIVDENGTRVAPGKEPDGSSATMTVVNVHEGFSDLGNSASRGSEGCVTIRPVDADAFFSNFDWSGANGKTGNSSGTVTIHRSDSEQRTLDEIKISILKTVSELEPEVIEN